MAIWDWIAFNVNGATRSSYCCGEKRHHCWSSGLRGQLHALVFLLLDSFYINETGIWNMSHDALGLSPLESDGVNLGH